MKEVVTCFLFHRVNLISSEIQNCNKYSNKILVFGSVHSFCLQILNLTSSGTSGNSPGFQLLAGKSKHSKAQTRNETGRED